jgi:hypothetical protein
MKVTQFSNIYPKKPHKLYPSSMAVIDHPQARKREREKRNGKNERKRRKKIKRKKKEMDENVWGF